jgi:ABC-2 type transport system permease protein
MKRITRYFWIASTAAKANLAYALETSSRVIFLTVILYVFMRLWTTVYAGASADRLAGFTLPQMLWYLVVTESVALSAPRISGEVDQDVRTGRLAVQLIYPLSYMGAHLSRAMGQRIVRFAINLTMGAAIALVLVGPITLTAKGLGMFLVILPAAFLWISAAIFWSVFAPSGWRARRGWLSSISAWCSYWEACCCPSTCIRKR